MDYILLLCNSCHKTVNYLVSFLCEFLDLATELSETFNI
jgi:hypothetical protein